MVFLRDMTFQYFFFSTYPVYVLEALPFALLGGILWGGLRLRRDRIAPLSQKAASVLFACYLTGLCCLTLFLGPLGALWYRLIYRTPSGIALRFFTWDFAFMPDPLSVFYDGERIANALLFFPYGILCPLSQKHPSWTRTVRSGFLCSAGIELLQPIFGRAFDINDIFMNLLGLFASASLLFLLLCVFRKRPRGTFPETGA